MPAVIEMQGVSKDYPMPGGTVHALRGVDLQVDEAELVSIVGSSGSGKSTLLYLLGLLISPSAGDYRFRGQAMHGLADRERSQLRGRSIGFVFQSFHLVPQLTVLKNVLLAARYAESNGNNGLVDRAQGLLERVGLSHRLRHRPTELSNGEMQRVAVARALLTDPDVILADEPTGNLDERNGDEIFTLFEGLQEEGKTIVVVTHDLRMAERTGRMITLHDGQVAS